MTKIKTLNSFYLQKLWIRLSLFFLGLIFVRTYVSTGAPWSGPILCVFRAVTGQPCPLCGTTRSIASAIFGDFDQAVSENIVGLTTAAILVISFINPKIGSYLVNSVESYRVRVGVKKFILTTFALFGLLWVWNISRWI